jgi:hypothetical protein
MEKIYLTLAVEAVAHIELKRLKEARKKMENDPKPLPVDLSGWAKEMETSLKNQMETTARSIVQKAKTEIESMFSVDGLKAGVLKVFHQNLSNEVEGPLLLQYLPLLQKEMEAALLSREMERFNSRFAAVDGEIRNWQGKIPKPFSPELINTDGRFPISRCRELQGRYYDVWLSDALKSKPIFWDAVDYIDKLTIFWETIFKPIDEAEKRAKEPKIEPSPQAPPIEEKIKGTRNSDHTSFAARHPSFDGGEA